MTSPSPFATPRSDEQPPAPPGETSYPVDYPVDVPLLRGQLAIRHLLVDIHWRR